MRHAVLEHPAVARAVRDDLVQRGRVHAFAQPQRHGLGGGRDVHASQELVDDLHLAAGARAIAQAVDLGGHGVERRAAAGVGLGAAGGHHRHLAAGGLGGAAADGRVQHPQAQRLEPRLQRDGPVGVDSAAHHEGAAGLQRRGHAAAAEEHVLGLRGIDHHAHHHVAGGREFGCAGTRGAAVAGEAFGGPGAHVEDVRRQARPAQRRGHARAHGPKADEPDAGRGGGRGGCVHAGVSVVGRSECAAGRGAPLSGFAEGRQARSAVDNADILSIQCM